jgi:hypothetical protein
MDHKTAAMAACALVGVTALTTWYVTSRSAQLRGANLLSSDAPSGYTHRCIKPPFPIEIVTYACCVQRIIRGKLWMWRVCSILNRSNLCYLSTVNDRCASDSIASSRKSG